MRHAVSYLVAMTVAAGLLSGCGSSQISPQQKQKNAVTRLGKDAAEFLVKEARWDDQTSQQVILISQPAVYSEEDNQDALHVTPRELRDALTRGLLSLKHPPRVVTWAPSSTSELPASLWVLDARLLNSTPLPLSDRTLYPYRLELRIGHNDKRPLSMVTQGAFDGTSVPRVERP
ncbi:hypothetical protein [Carnimonas nigrificans]|uniref:hypothetical protein n=1 Tax=Carnimonas nigrificans TaxID=64323 RepID=UPI0004723F8B|nr:hypothetical protein [Carnimonas nigrificans]